MQSLANKASVKVSELNSNDMQMKRQKLSKLVANTSGRKGVNISIDARYNSVTFGNRNKPGINASQAIMTAISQEGEKKERNN